MKFIMKEMHIPYFWCLTSTFSIFAFVYSTFIDFKIVGIVIMCSCGMTKLYNMYYVWDCVPAELQTFISSGGHVLCLRLWRKCSVSSLVETKKKNWCFSFYKSKKWNAHFRYQGSGSQMSSLFWIIFIIRFCSTYWIDIMNPIF
jgi:hypothetical protein